MTTMRPILRRVELSWIGFLLVGALCGALLMFGADAVRQSSHDVAAPIVAAPVAANSVPIGGRRGSMVSADTAAGWYLLHEYNPPALPSTVGPVEGPNIVAPDSAASDSIPPIIDPSEGLNPKR